MRCRAVAQLIGETTSAWRRVGHSHLKLGRSASEPVNSNSRFRESATMREGSRHICSRVYGVACVVIRPLLQAPWRKQRSQVIQCGVRERKQKDTTGGHGMKVRSGMVGVGMEDGSRCGRMSDEKVGVCARRFLI